MLREELEVREEIAKILDWHADEANWPGDLHGFPGMAWERFAQVAALIRKAPPRAPVGESFMQCPHGRSWAGPCTICGRDGKPVKL